MKIISFLFLLIILPIQISAQVTEEWVSRYNGPGDLDDFSRDLAVDSEGNIYVTGSSYGGSTNWDYATIKYDSAGNEQWVQRYSGSGNSSHDEATSIVLDNEGNVCVTGYISGDGTRPDYATIKYNSEGVQQWVQIYNSPGNGDDRAKSIAVDSDGNVYVTGYSFGNVTITDYDYTTIKYSSTGVQQWVKTYNGNGTENDEDIAAAIVSDSQGNVYVTGVSYRDNNGYEYATIKYNSAGIEQWVQRYHDLNHSSSNPSSITVDNQGNVYVTGSLYLLTDSYGGETLYDYATVKYNSAGVEQWVQKYNGTAGDFSVDTASDLVVDNNGNVYVTGSSEGETISDYATVKYNADGVEQWVQRYNGIGNGEDRANSIAIDNNSNIYVTGVSIGNSTLNDYTTIKYNAAGDSQWVQTYNGTGNNDDYGTAVEVDNIGNVYVTGFSVGIPITSGYDYATIKYSQPTAPRYPVFIVPGIAGTYAANLDYDLGWLLKRGISPDSIQIDPLGRVYDDIIITLENLGYEKGKDLFVVNYDWRLTPGPIDNIIDGRIDGVTGVSLSSGQFNYGVDYLGWYIKQACERWRQDHNEELDSIDIISHSTGGLVTRTYIQSDAYGAVYDNTNNYKLPKIRNFVMIGVPNRGASKPWNPTKDNWTGDIAYRFVLSKIINRAYQKVLQDNIITGPEGNITKSSIMDSSGVPNKELFISKYVPTIRYLLATYDFIDFGGGLTNINNDDDNKNTILLDLNNGFDINPLNDPNGFLDSANVTVIYGTGETTKFSVIKRIDFEFNAVQSFTDWIPFNALPGTVWYKDIEFDNNGDGTVPTISSAGQFLIDTRATLIEFATGDHTKLVSQINVQSTILDLLDVPYNLTDISTGNSTNYDVVSNIISDPVEFVLTDGSGNRIGYTNTTGAITEIQNSFWAGSTDGMGYVFGSIQEPINLQLTGLGENYYVMVSIEDSGKSGGVVLEGFLASGEVINYQITLNPVSVEQNNSLIPQNFALEQNYPNPFNPTTTIKYTIPNVTLSGVEGSRVLLKVYDVLGNEIATLVNEEKPAGNYKVEFNASNLASGIYFYRLQAGSFVETKKMILLR